MKLIGDSPSNEWIDVDHCKMGTVIFSDVSGFTNMSEKLLELGQAGAEELTKVGESLLEYLFKHALWGYNSNSLYNITELKNSSRLEIFP